MIDAGEMFAAKSEPYDSNNPLHVAEADLKAKRKQAEVREFLSDIMSKSIGRAWVYELLERCHMNHSCFFQGQPDMTGFALGERNVGLWLMAEIQDLTPQNYVKMCSEAKAKK